MPEVVIAAGGTGGHVMPALALREELLGRGYRVHFVTDSRGQAFVPEVSSLSILPIAGRAHLFSLIKSFLWSAFFLRKHAVQAVVSFGGYVAFPMNLAALVTRCPLILHEQNALLGRVNRWFAPFASRLALSWKTTARVPATKTLKKHIRLTGIPIRQNFQVVRKQDYRPPTSQGPIHLVVLGGSQGAASFAQIVPKALARLPEKLHKRIRLSLQCPTQDLAQAQEDCRHGNIDAEVSVFFKDIGERLEKAHWILSRSGASSVAEVAGVGRPALFVPYPFAMDDHQRANARAIVDEGGGWLCAQEYLTSARLATFLERVLTHPQALLFAAEKARAQGRLDAHNALANVVGEVLPLPC